MSDNKVNGTILRFVLVSGENAGGLFITEEEPAPVVEVGKGHNTDDSSCDVTPRLLLAFVRVVRSMTGDDGVVISTSSKSTLYVVLLLFSLTSRGGATTCFRATSL